MDILKAKKADIGIVNGLCCAQFVSPEDFVCTDLVLIATIVKSKFQHNPLAKLVEFHMPLP